MKSIYKFYPINRYSFDALKHNYIFCNHYESFNDPFECWCKIYNGIPDPIKDRERFLNVISVWGFTPETANEAMNYYYDYLSHFEEDQIDVDFLLNSAKISCFSSDPTNLLMWSHYADGLRGFCIVFDPNQLLDTKVCNPELIEVSYLNIPPTLETISYPLANDIFWHGEGEDSDQAVNFMFDFYSKMLGSKPQEWEYEREVRLIFHSHNNRIGMPLYYTKSAIQSIIIGDKMSSEDQKILIEIIKNINIDIPIKMAKRSEHQYRVILENLGA